MKHSGICAIGKNHPPAAFRRLCVETMKVVGGQNSASPAAFRRLCVETDNLGFYSFLCWNQPPSGGCVLKLVPVANSAPKNNQPPSGGCVLKPIVEIGCCSPYNPAAFRRLCVETLILSDFIRNFSQPPSGGCVLKHHDINGQQSHTDPAAFRRLCVETSARLWNRSD